MPDAVVLTGASGFVGRAVLAALQAQGIAVRAISRCPPPAALWADGVTWHSADLLTPQGRAVAARLGPRLIHCAWDVAHGTFWASPANPLWQAASRDLVLRFRAAGGGRVLALGTCAEYDTQALGPWNEARALAPATAYGQAKAALWQSLAEICGDDLVWARLFHLYGAGEDARRFVPSIICALQAGRFAQVRSANLIRDYASSGHIARCVVGLLLNGQARGAVNLGSGAPRSLGDLAQIIAHTLKRPDLLRCTSAPANGEPLFMAPDIALLRGYVQSCRELPQAALPRYVSGLRHA